jgi:hypothetical protein
MRVQLAFGALCSAMFVLQVLIRCPLCMSAFIRTHNLTLTSHGGIMRSLGVCLALCVVSFGASGCGGKSTSTPLSPTPTPTPTPTPPPSTTVAPPANRAPVITAATVSPASGISTLTTFAFSAIASDPDGDAITYSWDFDNRTSSNSAGASVVYNNANTVTYRPVLTVRDSQGATASTTLSVRSVSIGGTWQGTLDGIPITATMTQYVGGIVDGTWQMPSIGGVGEIGPAGEPGKIQANGSVELRFKVRVGSFSDSPDR